ncbi:hypothetical protein F5J12DRAFT_720879, partial [Pisolithus orientalis]|uniref:uncharacterized protein n=1 Tax=Pisolithus orientalis TaxID=936130 RepID=UPI002224F065
SSREISDVYQKIVAGKDIDWALLTYDRGGNLRVQSTGDGGLGELVKEFSNGRIHYALARAIDPNASDPTDTWSYFNRLVEFVQINWCGDGVPETKKGLFLTHSSSVVSLLREPHVVVNARYEVDVAPLVIMKRFEAAPGALYFTHDKQAREFEPIAPVGKNYTPVVGPDIAAMRKAPPSPNPSVAPFQSLAPRPAATTPALKPAVPRAPRPTVYTTIPITSKTIAATRAPAGT